MNNGTERRKIAYILSMKHGLPAFTHREITELRRLGLDVHCFIMRGGRGPYMPGADWPVVRPRWFDTALGLVGVAVRHPLRFARTAAAAVGDGGLIDLLIAAAFLGPLAARGIEAIYCNEGLHALWIGYYCRLFTGLPLVVIVHAEMVDRNLKPGLTRKCVAQCERILTVSEYNRGRIIEQFSVDERQVIVARHFAHFEPDDTLKVLIVGVWAERKGHATLLRAIREPGMEDFTVWVAGGGSWGEEPFDVARYVETNGLEDRVVIWGPVSEPLLELLYRNCDIFCLPSKTSRSGIKEGLPVVLMEGMFFGKPVISTRHTGIPELVPEILIEEGDHAALAAALRRLRAPELRREMGERNRQIVLERYSRSNVRRIAEVLGGVNGGEA